MWIVSTDIPVPEFTLSKNNGKTSVNSGVAIEEFASISSLNEITVVESEDHFCVLKSPEKEVKTEIPYDFEVPEDVEY